MKSFNLKSSGLKSFRNPTFKSGMATVLGTALCAMLNGSVAFAAGALELPQEEEMDLIPVQGDTQGSEDTSATSGAQPTTKLEDDASAWTVSILGSSSWNKANVTDPSVDGKALRITMSNAAEGSELQALRDTGARSSVGAYTFTTSFQLRDNRTLGSPAQDEFIIGFLRSDSGNTARAYLRWIPMDTSGNGTWYVYDPNVADQWRSLNVRANYITGTYYSLSFDANVNCTAVQYKKLILNGTAYNFSTSAGIIPTPNDINRVQASASLVANAPADGFVLYLDAMSVTSKSTKSVICSP